MIFAKNTPALRFPDAFRAWVDDDGLDDALMRFQLAAALNEVQQHAYTLHLADLFGLPELVRHAEYERRMALAYLTRCAPVASMEAFRQCVLVLDGLNAAVFAMTTRPSFALGLLLHARSANAEWAAFSSALEKSLSVPIG